MNWISTIIIIAVLLVLLAICYYRIKEAKHKPQDKRCLTCRKKTFDGIMEIRCNNWRSKHNGEMMDDDACCDKWRGRPKDE